MATMRVAWLPVALAACTYPEKEFADRLSCLGDPKPMTAEPVISISGNVLDPFEAMANGQPTPIPNATITLEDATGMILGPVTSGPDGGFTMSFTTGGTAFDNLYLKGTANGRVDTFLRPSIPLSTDAQVAYTMVSQLQRAALAMRAFGPGNDFMPGRGAILARVVDCTNQPIAGATLGATAGVVYYFNQFFPDPDAVQTDALGVVMVADVPVGPVILTPKFDGMDLATVNLTSVADSFIQMDLRP